MLVWMENTSNCVSFIETPTSKSWIIRVSSASSEMNINASHTTRFENNNNNNNDNNNVK